MGKKLTPKEAKALLHGIPRTRYPYALERYYARELKRMVATWKQIATDYTKRMLNPMVAGGSGILKTDDDDDQDNSHDVAIVLALMFTSIKGSQSDTDITYTTTRVINGISQYSYQNVERQASKFGHKAVRANQTIDNYVAMKIKENAALIKSMKQKYMDDLEKNVYRAINDGGGIGAVAEQINRVSDMSTKHAAMIARDQTGKITGQLNAYRQQQSGAIGYIWSTMGDDRVRPTHAALEGVFFKYNDPNGGADGLKPGEDYQCRCIADPVYEP